MDDSTDLNFEGRREFLRGCGLLVVTIASKWRILVVMKWLAILALPVLRSRLGFAVLLQLEADLSEACWYRLGHAQHHRFRSNVVQKRFGTTSLIYIC